MSYYTTINCFVDIAFHDVEVRATDSGFVSRTIASLASAIDGASLSCREYRQQVAPSSPSLKIRANGLPIA